MKAGGFSIRNGDNEVIGTKLISPRGNPWRYINGKLGDGRILFS